jgi:hypothetical protein
MLGATLSTVEGPKDAGVGLPPAEVLSATRVGSPRREPDRASASETPRRLIVSGLTVARRIMSLAPRLAVASFLVVLPLTAL